MTITQTAYEESVEQWRGEQEERLRRDWISLIGLFWLDEGANTVGSDPSNTIVLPTRAPAFVGAFARVGNQVTFTPHPSTASRVNGELARERVLATDATGAPDLVVAESLTLFLIARAERIGLRVRDAASPALRAFAGRRWMPVDERYRVVGQFVRYDVPKLLPIPNIIGDTNDTRSPGYALFTIDGIEHRLDATEAGAGSLVLHFRDASNGHETYGGGRAVRVSPGPNGALVVDFNQAANLPCAFTVFATCPIPPAQNALRVPILAGELQPEAH